MSALTAKTRTVFLAIVMTMSSSFAMAAPPRFIVVSHGEANDPFWDVVKNGVEEAKRDLKVDVEYQSPVVFNLAKMAELIDIATISKPDGLAVSIPDPEALRDSIRRAVDAGIPVVSFNSGLRLSKEVGTLAHVGQDEYEAGLEAGRRMKGAGITHALCINQEVGNDALDLRCAGFEKGLGEQVDVIGVSKDAHKVRDRVIRYLEAHPSTNGILGLGPPAAEPALEAVEKLELLGKIKIGTFDLSPKVLEAVRDGKMMFAIDQLPFMQGYLPVQLLTMHHRFDLMPGEVVVGGDFVTKEEAAALIDLSKDRFR